MKKFACPACGAEVTFAANFSVYAVCQFCSSMVVRHDMDVESIGKMASLPDDMSPFQIGTEGYYQNVHFGLIGRAKMAWSDGTWNEWLMLFDDMRRGWLAEAQGFYAVCFEVKNPEDEFIQKVMRSVKNDKEHKVLGTTWMIDERKFKVVDIKQANCVGCLGELPFVTEAGQTSIVVDLLGTRDDFASVEIELKSSAGLYERLFNQSGKQPSMGEIRTYVGRYVEWDALRCSQIRTFDGW